MIGDCSSGGNRTTTRPGAASDYFFGTTSWCFDHKRLRGLLEFLIPWLDDVPWDFEGGCAVGSFYRIFYRAGRNGLVIHSTVQHDESRKTRSDGTRRTEQHHETALQREFKSPLAHWCCCDENNVI